MIGRISIEPLVAAGIVLCREFDGLISRSLQFELDKMSAELLFRLSKWAIRCQGLTNRAPAQLSRYW